MPVSSSARPAAAAVVSHAADEDPKQHGTPALAGVRLVEHGRLAAAVAFNSQEPAREGPEWQAQGLGSRGQRLGAVRPPVPPWRRGQCHYSWRGTLALSVRVLTPSGTTICATLANMLILSPVV
jgi:hypothetical protein